MKVYTVVYSYYDDYWTEGAFLSEKKALSLAEKLNEDLGAFSGGYFVECIEVDEEVE